jgi:serine/threonine-protein kinase
VCKSLVEAHAAGIVHRDLKPGNVFLTEVVGETDFVKVLDFGIAKVRDTMPGATVHTQSGTVLGTPMYMAPEQGSAAPVTHAADLYSLGCILYHGLAGRPPFLGDTPLALMVQHAGQPVPSLGSVGAPMDLPAGLEDLVRHLLAKKPGDRPRDAAEVAARLEALGGAVKPSHARESRPGIARRRGLPWWLVAGMAAGVFSGAVASIALIGTSPAPVGSGGAVVDEVDSGDAVADGNTVLDAVPESPGIAIPIPDAGAALDSGPPQGPGVRPPPKLLPACEPSWCRRGLGNECRDPYGRKYRRQDYCLPGES